MAQYVSHCHRRVELERLEKRLGGDVDFRPGLRFKAMLDMEGKVVQLSVQEGGADRALFEVRGALIEAKFSLGVSSSCKGG